MPNACGNIGETELLVYKEFDCYLVCGIICYRQRFAVTESGIGKRNRREFFAVRLKKAQGAELRKLELSKLRGLPLGIGERILDGKAHIGLGKLGKHRTIAVFDHRMYDGLRMHKYLNVIGTEAEEPACLHKLKPLIEQAR